MPIYEYQCAACGQVLEKWQKFSDEPLKSCPACGGALSKLISSCAFHLKGSGWYVTDYAGNRSNAAAPGDSSQGAKDAAASGEPTEPKEAPKEASKEGSKKAEAAPKPETAASTKNSSKRTC
jgi:putative FmdB family regulatory protein